MENISPTFDFHQNNPVTTTMDPINIHFHQRERMKTFQQQCIIQRNFSKSSPTE